MFARLIQTHAPAAVKELLRTIARLAINDALFNAKLAARSPKPREEGEEPSEDEASMHAKDQRGFHPVSFTPIEEMIRKMQGANPNNDYGATARTTWNLYQASANQLLNMLDVSAKTWEFPPTLRDQIERQVNRTPGVNLELAKQQASVLGANLDTIVQAMKNGTAQAKERLRAQLMDGATWLGGCEQYEGTLEDAFNDLTPEAAEKILLTADEWITKSVTTQMPARIQQWANDPTMVMELLTQQLELDRLLKDLQAETTKFRLKHKLVSPEERQAIAASKLKNAKTAPKRTRVRATAKTELKEHFAAT